MQAPAAVELAKDMGTVKVGDSVIIVRGSVELTGTTGASNLIHVMTVK
jgi:hypothetical protein